VRYLLVCSTLASWIALAGTATAVDITTCGALVPEGETGVLQADLSGCADGVTLAQDATLQMNGHAILNSSAVGVHCTAGRCRVTGPGEIGGADFGIRLDGGTPGRHALYIDDVDVHDSGSFGIYAFARIIATNLSVRGTIANTFGVYAADLRGTGISVTDNTGNGIGVGKNARVIGLTVTGNGEDGLTAHGRIKLFDSTLTGNGDIDVLSPHRPRLRNTVCDHSGGREDSYELNWGICTSDPAP
jgi:hypothetical protein